ncbi:MAG: GGDEF domain-containing protein, partial [Gammaproteobacteria bacterium]
EVIATLVADTRSMRETNQAMSASLAEHLTQIADLREQLTVSRAAAKTDALTGLLNRGAYDDTLRREIATAHETEQPLSVVMVDIDRFKSINDSMGHLFGDKVI